MQITKVVRNTIRIKIVSFLKEVQVKLKNASGAAVFTQNESSPKATQSTRVCKKYGKAKLDRNNPFTSG